MKQKKRVNTKLESEGAEFLVLGHLLIEKLNCYKSYVNYPGFDLIAVNHDNGKSARIQVKSRFATDYDRSFPIKNFNCDFVVHVALNRGVRYRKSKNKDQTKEPIFYVFPITLVKKARNRKSTWGKVYLRKIPNYKQYTNCWSIIREYLQ